jgi:hypothetical protein
MFNRLDKWRQSPLLRATHFKHMFPGMGVGFGLFAVYFALETVFAGRGDSHNHGHAVEGKTNDHASH